MCIITKALSVPMMLGHIRGGYMERDYSRGLPPLCFLPCLRSCFCIRENRCQARNDECQSRCAARGGYDICRTRMLRTPCAHQGNFCRTSRPARVSNRTKGVYVRL